MGSQAIKVKKSLSGLGKNEKKNKPVCWTEGCQNDSSNLLNLKLIIFVITFVIFISFS